MTGSYVGKPSGGKLLRVYIEWEGATVLHASIRGDFFAHPEEGFDEAERDLAGASIASLGRVFADSLARRGVTLFGLDPIDVGMAVSSIVASTERTGPA